MAGDWPRENTVFLLRAAADIVDQQRALALLAVRNNPAMRELAADDAGDNIAGQIGLGLLGKRLLRPAAFEEGSHIRHAAMIDIAIRRPQPPDFGIGGKGLFHVEMDQLLQVKAQPVAIGADDDIGTGSRPARKVAFGIADAVIGLAVDGGHADLVARRFDKAGGTGLVRWARRGVGVRRMTPAAARRLRRVGCIKGIWRRRGEFWVNGWFLVHPASTCRCSSSWR